MDTPNAPTGTPSTADAQSAAGEIALKPNGPVAAVMIATGIGILVLGILTTVSEAGEGVADFLEFSERVGPLSGKTIFATAAFLLSWGGLHVAFRERDVPWRTAIVVLVALVALGLVLTFPPFFQLFESD